MNTISLKKDNFNITDLCTSPIEPDQVLICKSNGEIILMSKIFDKNFETVSKNSDASARNNSYWTYLTNITKKYS